jgi:high-affinity iron transporter
MLFLYHSANIIINVDNDNDYHYHYHYHYYRLKLEVENLKKLIVVPILICIMLVSQPVYAATSWMGVVSKISGYLNSAMVEYKNGDPLKAKNLVNEAYYGPFESERMEQAIRINISAKRAAEIEFQFNTIRKIINAGADIKSIEQEKDSLMKMLNTDAFVLLKAEQGSGGLWLYSLLIIVREGVEAILVISAITAYLIKSGNLNKVKEVYQSTFVAILASFLTAYLFRTIIHVSGKGQEVLEGSILIIAMVFLFSMGYWMLRNADPKRWKNHIEGMVKDSLTNGKRMMLWMAVFLAVYREGAETVLFYQALLADSSGDTNQIWLGFIVGAIILIVLFFVIRFTSTRLPLRPFFIFSGSLLYVLAFIFAGEGIKELQAGAVISNSSISGFPTIGTLGVFPSWEGVGMQSLMIIVTIIALSLRKKKIDKNT